MSTRARPAALVVLTTLADIATAREVIRGLLEARLIACGTMLPSAVSLYRWQGAIEDAPETLVLLKTRAEHWEALRDALRDAHPYAVPEMLAVPVTAAWEPYLDWIMQSTRPEEAS